MKITIVGGCGHVGFPLGLLFAQKYNDVTLFDIDIKTSDAIRSGNIPFVEAGAYEILESVLNKFLFVSSDPVSISKSDYVVFTINTELDFEHFFSSVKSYRAYLRPDQLIIFRSTLHPESLETLVQWLNLELSVKNVAYCPERLAQGSGINELQQLPQIISGANVESVELARKLFSVISPQIIELTLKEASLAKLICNSWRYLEFAIANQFYMVAARSGVDFYRLYDAMTANYPRAKSFARPGLAAGPCLLKDTLQIVNYDSDFSLGHCATTVNQGLPAFIVNQLEEKMGTLTGRCIAILGMSFKANSDDTRNSLSFVLKNILEAKNAKVICSDDIAFGFSPLPHALEKGEGFILAVPHEIYRKLKINKPYVDCWGLWNCQS